jgi:hypothetical protein
MKPGCLDRSRALADLQAITVTRSPSGISPRLQYGSPHLENLLDVNVR